MKVRHYLPTPPPHDFRESRKQSISRAAQQKDRKWLRANDFNKNSLHTPDAESSSRTHFRRGVSSAFSPAGFQL